MEITAMVKALARLMNPAEPNPVFSAKNQKEYVNTLGKGLSRFYFLAAKKSFISTLILANVKAQENSGKFMAKLLFNERMTADQALETIEKMYCPVGEIDFSKFDGSAEDKEAAIELIKRCNDGDRLATAAIWLPTLLFWFSLTGGDAYRATIKTNSWLTKFLNVENKINQSDVRIEEMREWGKVEFAEFLPIRNGFLHVGYDFGKKLDDKRFGWLSTPHENDISAIPFLERKHQWDLLRNKYKEDTKRAIDLVLHFKQASTGASYTRRLPVEFVTNNPEWMMRFVADVRALSTMNTIWDFAKEQTKPNIFEPKTQFDGEKIFSYIENVLRMAVEMPDQYANHAAIAIDNICGFLKNVYQLKDED